MAERRMFAKTIIDSDAFLDMPASTQALYFHLSMRADDDGFLNNPKKIQKIIGATDDDLKLLMAKRFILLFESGVIVIKHWKMHNYIRMDRYKPTVYQEEKKLLEIKENGSYSDGMSIGIPDDNQRLTQVRLGKVSIGKDSIDKDKEPDVYKDLSDPLKECLKTFVEARKATKRPMTDRAIKMLLTKLDEMSGGNEYIAIKILEQSIVNGWQGIFPLKEEKQTGNPFKVMLMREIKDEQKRDYSNYDSDSCSFSNLLQGEVGD